MDVRPKPSVDYVGRGVEATFNKGVICNQSGWSSGRMAGEECDGDKPEETQDS